MSRDGGGELIVDEFTDEFKRQFEALLAGGEAYRSRSVTAVPVAVTTTRSPMGV